MNKLLLCDISSYGLTLLLLSSSSSHFASFLHLAFNRSIFEINGTGPGWLGAGHAEEIPFVFGYPFLPELDGYHGPMTDEEKELSVKLIKYWTHFAWTGYIFNLHA